MVVIDFNLSVQLRPKTFNSFRKDLADACELVPLSVDRLAVRAGTGTLCHGVSAVNRGL
jgi:hypothetical protein